MIHRESLLVQPSSVVSIVSNCGFMGGYGILTLLELPSKRKRERKVCTRSPRLHARSIAVILRSSWACFSSFSVVYEHARAASFASVKKETLYYSLAPRSSLLSGGTQDY